MTIIVGGGLSGLSAAFYFSQRFPNAKASLLEATKRCGGWVKTTLGSDYTFESGPRTIRPTGPLGANTLNLIEDLGIEDKVIPIQSNHPAARNRLIYAKNQLNLLPSSIFSLFKVHPPFSKSFVSFLRHDLGVKPFYSDDDTVYNFVERRFGKELADYAISPVICGICAGDAKEISVKFLFKDIFELEQKHGSVVNGLLRNITKRGKMKYLMNNLAKKSRLERWSIYSFKGGLEQLTIELKDAVTHRGIDILNNHKIKEIIFNENNSEVSVKTEGQTFSSEHLFSCIPAFELAPLLKNNHPFLSEELNKIPFVDVAVINLQYNGQHLKQEAFGLLVPPNEKLPILGIIFDSSCFSHQKGTVLTVMMGGKWFKENFGENPSEDQLLDIALKQVNNILQIDQAPDAYKVNVLRKCIPQYIVGHNQRISQIRQYISDKKLPLSLCGASFDGVGVNDVISSARQAVVDLAKTKNS